ncbi:transcription and mRNA export factor ENY2-like [Salvia splendens]|uniref:transcription and mRNA export factor ENY2-like n=1 Tax=Salvia splendens TaxID=180675 RepID=UPI001C251FF3|nr:transcription and mRNA export factor ENY2-like [Salvia splendens]
MLGRRNASIQPHPTPDAEMERAIHPSLQQIVDLKVFILLINSWLLIGEKERLKELLVERLVECGWKDEMKALCREFARKKGRDTITVHELVKVITPKGRAFVPDSVKAEMLQRIRSFLTSTTT